MHPLSHKSQVLRRQCDWQNHCAFSVAKHSRDTLVFRDMICNRFMYIGYARVSTDDQHLDIQLQALKQAGCKRIFQEKISGARRQRPELAKMLEHLREGDTVVVWKLDRLARSTRDLLEIADTIDKAGAGLKSLCEPWADTTSPAGRMVLTVFAGIAEFERELIRERTGTGRIAAMKRGVRFGRPSRLTTEQMSLARRLLEEGNSAREVAKTFGVHKATIYRAIAAEAKSRSIEAA
jgi:DNA invertase Pin-like site-specific DNA recombinase